MQCKKFSFTVALTATLTTNLLNPPTASGGVNAGSSAQFIVLKHIRVVNTTAAIVNLSLWRGASGANAAGTQVVGTGLPVPANSSIDYYGELRFDSGDFLVGGGSAVGLTLTGEGEIGVAG